MMLWTAFLLGLAGSLHCAGMCGPLVMALPGLGLAGAGGHDATRPRRGGWLGRAVYHAGRIGTYACLGVLFGFIGQSAVWAGFQRWISLAAGAAILLGLLVSRRLPLGLPAVRLVSKLKPWFGPLLGRSSPGSLFCAGLLNGLLPCGLVYAACAGATAAGSVGEGVLFMAAFGLGTVPLMFSLGWLGARFQSALRFRLQRWVPASLVLVALLLVMRGLTLGIPYLSPGPLEHPGTCPACAQR